MKFGRSASLSAMALAVLSMALPAATMAQERDFRRGGRGEGRADRPARPMMQSRGDFRQQRQITPRSMPSDTTVGSPRLENRGGREFRGYRNDGQRQDWGGRGSATSGTWQQRQQGIPGNPEGDSRTAEQWRERRQNRIESQTGSAVIRRAPGSLGWRDDRRDTDRRPNVQRENRPNWQTSREGWRSREERRDGRPAWQSDRQVWQNGRRTEGWRNDAWRNDGRRDNGWRNDRRDNRSWDRGWRNNSRYDWSSYRARNRGVYRIGRYVSPYSSYRYSRFGVGFRMQPLFFRQNYWLSDPWQYRLPEVYGPYRWVRYYDDVVLVDVYTGEVVDVIYDFFW